MKSESSIPLPIIGSEVTTACGSPDKFTFETPHVLHEGKWIFFCTPGCQQDFIRDPQNSCLTNHIREEAD